MLRLGEEIAEYYRSEPAVRVSIEGQNQALSELRAASTDLGILVAVAM